MSPYKMVYGKACHLPLELEYNAYWAIKELNYDSNLPVRGDFLTLAHLMNGEPRLMKMPSCLKKKLKDGMIKGYKSVSLIVGDYVLLYNSHLRLFAGKLLSKWEGPYVIEEVYRSGAIKINNFEGTNPKVVNG